MRLFYLATLLTAFFAFAASANAAELLVLSPGFVYNAGLQDLAADFTKQTGVKVTVKSIGMGSAINQIKTGTPAADVVILPMEPFDLMGNLAKENAVVSGTFTPLGRVEIVLAVKAGAPHPDISTVDKLVAVLKSAKAVMRSNPGKVLYPGYGSMEALIIDRLLKMPEFAGVHSVISTKGEGGQALARGEGDMALQLVCEVYPHPEISSVGPLPADLYAHMDAAAAVSARTADEKDARSFIAFITRPEAASVWKAKGLDRF